MSINTTYGISQITTDPKQTRYLLSFNSAENKNIFEATYTTLNDRLLSGSRYLVISRAAYEAAIKTFDEQNFTAISQLNLWNFDTSNPEVDTMMKNALASCTYRASKNSQ